MTWFNAIRVRWFLGWTIAGLSYATQYLVKYAVSSAARDGTASPRPWDEAFNGWVGRARVEAASGSRNARPFRAHRSATVNRVADTLRGQRPTTDRAKVDTQTMGAKMGETVDKVKDKLSGR